MKLFTKNGINFEELFNKPELSTAEDVTEFIDVLEKIFFDNISHFLCDIYFKIKYIYLMKFQD